MPAEIRAFVQQVMKISPPSTDIGHGVIPSLSGMVNSGSDNAQQLQRAVAAFAHAYSGQQSDPDLVRRRAEVVEGLLMASVTLGTITESDAVTLIDELHDLIVTT